MQILLFRYRGMVGCNQNFNMCFLFSSNWWQCVRWLVLSNWQKLRCMGKRESQFRDCLHQTGLGASLWDHFLECSHLHSCPDFLQWWTDSWIELKLALSSRVVLGHGVYLRHRALHKTLTGVCCSLNTCLESSKLLALINFGKSYYFLKHLFSFLLYKNP